MEIVSVPTASLVSDPSNARSHSRRNLDAIKGSLAVYGQRRPLVVNRNGNVVEAGNGTLAAAIELGWELIDVVYFDDDPATAMGFAIADNRTAELAEWHEDNLALTLAALKDAGEPIDYLGWSENELDGLLSAPDVAPVEIADEPEEYDLRVATGDVWSLDGRILRCGDSTVLQPQSVDCLFWDPPWDAGIDARPWVHAAKNALVFCDGGRARDVAAIQPERLAWLFVWDCVSSWYTPNRPLRRHKQCWWFGDVADYEFDGAHYGDAGATRTVSNTRGSYEFQPDPRGKHLSDLFSAPITKEHSDGHKHGKPLDWVRMLIANTSSGDVFDPFAGGGVSLFAAMQLDRGWSGWELDPGHCSKIVAQWELTTGKKAERI